MSLFNVKRAVFFGAHTDDEMVAAGTLHRLGANGVEVTVVAFSPAAIEEDRKGGMKSQQRVYTEWLDSMEAMKTRGIFLPLPIWNPSRDLPKYGQEICQYIYDYCERQRPDVAFILSPFDENTAHAVVGVEAERVMRGRVPVVLRCNFPWNYGKGDRPNLYVSLGVADLEAKRRVIQAYQSQKFRYDYLDMLLKYAHADGMSVKAAAAERFELVRGVI